MRALEDAQRTITVLFLVALALFAATSGESRHLTGVAACFIAVALVHLGLALRLRGVFSRDLLLLDDTSEVRFATAAPSNIGGPYRAPPAGPPATRPRGWDGPWVIVAGDALLTVALTVVVVVCTMR